MSKIKILPIVQYREDKEEKEYKSPIEKYIKPKTKRVKNQLRFLADTGKNNLLPYNI